MSLDETRQHQVYPVLDTAQIETAKRFQTVPSDRNRSPARAGPQGCTALPFDAAHSVRPPPDAKVDDRPRVQNLKTLALRWGGPLHRQKWTLAITEADRSA
jgi:hypothetical protein